MTYSSRPPLHPSLSGAHISCPSSSCFNFRLLFLCSSLSGLSIFSFSFFFSLLGFFLVVLAVTSRSGCGTKSASPPRKFHEAFLHSWLSKVARRVFLPNGHEKFSTYENPFSLIGRSVQNMPLVPHFWTALRIGFSSNSVFRK